MPKVLIIEDESAYQQILNDAFKKEQFEVIIATDVQEASADVNKTQPDIILLDIMLPGGRNGFDFLEELKANESTNHIPVIVITNLASEEKVAKEIGASFYFIKSDTTIQQIIAKVKQVLP